MIQRTLGVAALLLTACGPPPLPPLPPNTFAFGVFGDAPYRVWEWGRFRGLVRDVNRAELAWLLHVGDILWYPCSDEEYGRRLDALNEIRHPVVYTPGDNEWADCHAAVAGRYAPLERLARLRAIFFVPPGGTLGSGTLVTEAQSRDTAFAEFVENVRWRFGGYLFATLHLVGSENATEPFRGRTVADDDAVARRTQAALAWLEEAFAAARADSLRGIVLAMHGNPWNDEPRAVRRGYGEFVRRLAELVTAFPGQVLLIHGDSHTQRLDRPLVDPATGRVADNFLRLETFGSPDIGWVRVVVDSAAGRFVAFEPRRMPPWILW